VERHRRRDGGRETERSSRGEETKVNIEGKTIGGDIYSRRKDEEKEADGK
jgi:hypothetical protein